jgi:hypothetical protein
MFKEKTLNNFLLHYKAPQKVRWIGMLEIVKKSW